MYLKPSPDKKVGSHEFIGVSAQRSASMRHTTHKVDKQDARWRGKASIDALLMVIYINAKAET
jgi:hypothetical protein